MKSGDSFQLSYDWWKNEHAKTLPKSGLGKLLKTYEDSLKDFAAAKPREGARYLQAYATALQALDEVDTGRLKAIALCKDLIHKETKEALGRDAVIDQARKKFNEDIVNALSPMIEPIEASQRKLEKNFILLEKLLDKAKKSNGDEKDLKAQMETFTETFASAAKAQVVVSSGIARMPPPAPLRARAPSLGARVEAIQTAYRAINLKELEKRARAVWPMLVIPDTL